MKRRFGWKAVDLGQGVQSLGFRDSRALDMGTNYGVFSLSKFYQENQTSYAILLLNIISLHFRSYIYVQFLFILVYVPSERLF